MKCPFCGQEMTLGYVQCRDGLYWTPKKQPVAALSVFGRGSISLENGAGRSAAFAHRCDKCKKVIIDSAQPE